MILVTGATGNVGSAVLSELSARGVPCRALTRDPARASFPERVETVAGSTSDPTAMASALAGVDAVFLNLIGDPQPTLEALAKTQPSRAVLLSSLTAGTRPDLAYAVHFAELEASVRQVAPKVCILRPGQFTSNVARWRPMLANGVVRAPFLDVALPPIAPEDIGAMAAQALTSDAWAGQTLTLSGPALVSPRQQIATLAEVTGQPLSAVEVPEDQFRSTAGMPPHLVEYLVQVMGHPSDDELQISPTVASVTGQDPLTFTAWAELNRHLFT